MDTKTILKLTSLLIGNRLHNSYNSYNYHNYCDCYSSHIS